MAHHKLKIEEVFMHAKKNGDKNFEIRFNDRGFQKGDTVSYTKDTEPNFQYHGTYEITFVTSFAQKENWVVFGEKILTYKT